MVMDVKLGPQSPPGVKFVVRLVLVGLLTLVLREMPWTFGAHLKELPMLPELPVPPLPEKLILTGFADQSTLGWEFEA